jgi:hypothetical protein
LLQILSILFALLIDGLYLCIQARNLRGKKLLQLIVFILEFDDSKTAFIGVIGLLVEKTVNIGCMFAISLHQFLVLFFKDFLFRETEVDLLENKFVLTLYLLLLVHF